MVKSKNIPKARLKNLDDLFNLNDGVNPLEQTVPVIEMQPHHKRVVVSIVIDNLTPFSGHPFRLYEGERLEDMVASIKANGVLIPIIVRRIESNLEILAGHNRVNAAKLAGLSEVPTIVFENVSDEDAMVYVVETNLLQRSFSDMTHSEKAAVIALHHSKMFSQGKRNDILEQINMLENPHEYREKETSRPIGERLGADGIVAEKYSLSKRMVSRYLRIQYLIPTLKAVLDDELIALFSAVSLSYLTEAEQTLVANYMEREDIVVDMKKADALRQYSDKGKLNSENVHRILSGEVKAQPNRTPMVKVSKAAYAKYFKPNQSAKEIQDIVEKALALFFEQR